MPMAGGQGNGHQQIAYGELVNCPLGDDIVPLPELLPDTAGSIDGIVTEVASIEGLLGVYDPYLTIPDYQRGYKWEESDVTQLLEDIDKSLQNHLTHVFLGSIILHFRFAPKRGNEVPYLPYKSVKSAVKNSRIKWVQELKEDSFLWDPDWKINLTNILKRKKKVFHTGIVDGQQRLVTLYILAKTLSVALHEYGAPPNRDLENLLDHDHPTSKFRRIQLLGDDEKDLNSIYKKHSHVNYKENDITWTERGSDLYIKKGYKACCDWLSEKVDSLKRRLVPIEDGTFSVSTIDDDEFAATKEDGSHFIADIDEIIEVNDRAFTVTDCFRIWGNVIITLKAHDEEVSVSETLLDGQDIEYRLSRKQTESEQLDSVKEGLVKYTEYLLTRAVFILVRLKSDSRVHEIFNTLNATGKNLTEAEKFRNYVLHIANSAPFTSSIVYERAKVKLSDVDSAINQARGGYADHATKFLHNFIISKNWKLGSGKPAERSVFKILKRELEHHLESVDHTEFFEFLDELGDSAKAWKYFHKPDGSKWNGEYDNDFRDFIQTKQQLPLFMDCRDLDQAQMGLLVKAWTTYVVRKHWVDTGSAIFREEKTSMNWIEIRHEDGFDSMIDAIKSELKQHLQAHYDVMLTATLDRRFKTGLTTTKFASSSGNAKAKMILRNIEGLGAHAPSYDTMNIQLEHIYPHGMTGRTNAYRDRWEAECPFGNETEKEELVQSLGNLILLEKFIHHQVGQKTWKWDKRVRLTGPHSDAVTAKTTARAVATGDGKTPEQIRKEGDRAYKREWEPYGKLHYYANWNGGSKTASVKSLNQPPNNTNRQSRNWTKQLIEARRESLVNQAPGKFPLD
jgi:hypothetical protein